MKIVAWKASRGRGGYQASYESVKARSAGNEWEVVFICPTSVDCVDTFSNRFDAVAFAKSYARSQGFQVDE